MSWSRLTTFAKMLLKNVMLQRSKISTTINLNNPKKIIENFKNFKFQNCKTIPKILKGQNLKNFNIVKKKYSKGQTCPN